MMNLTTWIKLKTAAILLVGLLIIFWPDKPIPLTLMKLLIVGVSLAGIITILEYIIYTELKSRYGKSPHETLKLGSILLVSLFKETIIFWLRLYLLFLIVFLPLMGVAFFTSLFAASLIHVLSFNVPLFVWALMPSSLLADVLIIHYFLGKYGAVYKLPFVLLLRKNTRLSSIECISSWAMMLVGSLTYFVLVGDLLMSLINATSLLKIGVGAIITLLVVYVLRNRKYQNVMNLHKKIIGCDQLA